MAHRANKRPPGRIKSSIVARLNTRLFFRLLGIYFTMDLLLLILFCGGLFVWSEQQAAQISTLVEERGVPSAEATEWMTAGDYTVTAGTPEAVEVGFDADAVIKAISGNIKGGGGGKAAMAQAGGKDASGIDAALQAARDMLL